LVRSIGPLQNLISRYNNALVKETFIRW